MAERDLNKIPIVDCIFLFVNCVKDELFNITFNANELWTKAQRDHADSDCASYIGRL